MSRRLPPWLAWMFAAWIAAAAGSVRAQHTTDSATPAKTTSPQRAKSRPRAALFATAGPSASALDAMIHSALEELEVVRIVAAPGMDLQATQLAVDCVGETARCLRTVARRSRAQVLIAPSLQRTSSEVLLSVLRFDAADGGNMRRVLRRQTGPAIGSELLDAVPDMLRELFDLPRPEPHPEVLAAPEATPAVDPLAGVLLPDEPPEDRGLPLGPLVLAGAGVAAIGGGIAMGIVMNNQQAEYERLGRRVQTEAQAHTAIDARSTGESHALASTVLFAVGGAALLGAGLWFALDRLDAEESATAFAPLVGPNRLALTWMHRGDVL